MATTTDPKAGAGMHNPAHPGEILSTLYLEPLGVSITEAAAALGMSRKQVSEVVNGRAAVTPALAIRLAIAFATDAEFWMSLQSQYDLWVERQKEAPVVTPLRGADGNRVTSRT